MKKVKSIIILKKTNGKWGFVIPDKRRVIIECLQQWHKTENAEQIELSFEIKSPFQFKTQSQLGYIFASVKPSIVKWFQDLGNEGTPAYIWDNVKSQVDFIERKVSPVDGNKYWAVKSLATASKEEVSEFIDKVVRWAADFGIDIETPEDYKKRLGIKDFK